jgi:O-antigen/teichoic acid export membrane protein
MNRLSTNLIASLASRAWAAMLLLLLVPTYVSFLGVEAYGVVGAFVSIQALMSLLDLGFSAALTRELARLSAEPGTALQMRDLLRTLEIIYWGFAALIVIAIWLMAPVLSTHWLRPEKLAASELRDAITAAGLAFALQWPTNLYSGGLQGMQRQLTLAAIIAITGTLRAAFTVLALWLIAPTLKVFFLAQAGANLLQTAVVGAVLWRCLPHAQRWSRFRVHELRSVLGFAGGMAGISLTTVALTQLDKAILSRTLPLEKFGYYAVAGTLASGLYLLISPMFAVLFPKFSQLVSEGDPVPLQRLYDTSSQLMSALVVPAAAVMALFAPEILALWTRNADIVHNSHIVLSLLILGNAMNGLMNVPYAVQLAHGWTRLAFYSNIVAIALCVPLTYFLSVRYGAPGGASVWVLLTLGYLVASLPLFHRKLLRGRLQYWYLVDLGAPAAAALLVVGMARGLIPLPTSALGVLLVLAAVGVAAVAAAVMAAPQLRPLVLNRLVISRALC